MPHTFNPTILREYDIRGIVGDTLSEADATAIGRSYATIARNEGATRVAVGRDGRLSSPALEAALVEGLRAGGLDVVRIGLSSSPMLYFAAATLPVDGGIEVTGSHNPADYNGFKMLLNNRSIYGEEIQKLGRISAHGDWTTGEGRLEEAEVIDDYVAALVLGFDGGEYRIGWDPGNGAGGPALAKLLAQLPGEHHTINMEVDGHFPHHHPDPTVEKNLEDLKKLVADKGLDFGIAFDGDADRIGAVDSQGRVIWGDQLVMILAEPVLKALPGSTIIADVKASQTLFDRIAQLGGKPLMWKTGHSLIKAKMKETGAPLAGEMSGHIFFKHEWFGFDDALNAAVRLIRAVTASGKSLTQLKSEIPPTVATPELRFQVDETRKAAVVQEVAARLAADGAKVDKTDGVRVNTPDGWWLLRASNTQDVLVARAESHDQAGLDRLMEQVNHQLEASGIDAVEMAH